MEDGRVRGKVAHQGDAPEQQGAECGTWRGGEAEADSSAPNQREERDAGKSTTAMQLRPEEGGEATGRSIGGSNGAGKRRIELERSGNSASGAVDGRAKKARERAASGDGRRDAEGTEAASQIAPGVRHRNGGASSSAEMVEEQHVAHREDKRSTGKRAQRDEADDEGSGGHDGTKHQRAEGADDGGDGEGGRGTRARVLRKRKEISYDETTTRKTKKSSGGVAGQAHERGSGGTGAGYRVRAEWARRRNGDGALVRLMRVSERMVQRIRESARANVGGEKGAGRRTRADRTTIWDDGG